MPKKIRTSKNQVSVRVGNISDVSGNVDIAGGNIISTNTGVSPKTESEKLIPRLLGDSSTDAPPPDVGKKKKRKAK